MQTNYILTVRKKDFRPRSENHPTVLLPWEAEDTWADWFSGLLLCWAHKISKYFQIFLPIFYVV